MKLAFLVQITLSLLLEAQTFTIAPALLDLSGSMIVAQNARTTFTKKLMEMSSALHAHPSQEPLIWDQLL